MEVLMQSPTFFLEQPQQLGKTNYNCLRLLYLPLVGSEAIILYELLCDLAEHRLKATFSFQELTTMMQVELAQVERSLRVLEAVGLLKRFVKDQDTTCLLSLTNPLSVDKFDKNALLKAHLIAKIGLREYETIYTSRRTKAISKTGYTEISQRYQDVFPSDFATLLHNNTEAPYTTLDLAITGFNTHQENIEKLPASHFIKHQLSRNPTFNETMMISALLNLGFHDATINLLVDFSLRHNQRLVVNYISKIAQDFAARGIIHFADVSRELTTIDAIKATRQTAQLNKVIIKQEAKKLAQNLSKPSAAPLGPVVAEFFSEEELEEMF